MRRPGSDDAPPRKRRGAGASDPGHRRRRLPPRPRPAARTMKASDSRPAKQPFVFHSRRSRPGQRGGRDARQLSLLFSKWPHARVLSAAAGSPDLSPPRVGAGGGGPVSTRRCQQVAGSTSRRGRVNILVFKRGQRLSPEGEVAESVRAGEVRGVASFQQREDVVHHFTESHVPGRRRTASWPLTTPSPRRNTCRPPARCPGSQEESVTPKGTDLGVHTRRGVLE